MCDCRAKGKKSRWKSDSFGLCGELDVEANPGTFPPDSTDIDLRRAAISEFVGLAKKAFILI